MNKEMYDENGIFDISLLPKEEKIKMLFGDVNYTPLKIKQYINEQSKEILGTISTALNNSKKLKMLNISNMATGKSTFVLNELRVFCKTEDKSLVVITPNRSLLIQIVDRYKELCCGVCDGKEVDTTKDVIVTTPDSFGKVVNALKDKEIITVYDEIHKVGSDYNYRPKIDLPLRLFESKENIKVFIALTATPDTIIREEKWDKIYVTDVENAFMQSLKLGIVSNLSASLEDRVGFIISQKRHFKDHPLIVKLDNKEQLEKMRPILIKMGYKTNVFYRDNENEEDNKMLNNMLKGIGTEFTILLTTCIIDAGVEIPDLEHKPVLIDIVSNLVSSSQSTGRSRQGLKYIIWVTPRNAENNSDIFEDTEIETPEDEIIEKTAIYYEIFNNKYKTLKKYYYRKAEDELKTALKHDWVKNTSSLLKTKFNDTTGLYESEIDKRALDNHIMQVFLGEILRDNELLIAYCKLHPAINIPCIGREYVNKKQLDKIKLEIKYDVIDVLTADKELKEELEEEIKELYNFVKKLTEYECDYLVTKDLDIESNYMIPKELSETEYNNLVKKEEDTRFDVGTLQQLREYREFWFSKELKIKRKNFYDIRDTIRNVSIKTALLIALDNNKLKEYKKQLKVCEINRKYNRNIKIQDLDKKYDKEKVKIYYIRNYINKVKEKERDVVLSKKFKEQMLQELKKEKSLYKLTINKLDKLLKLIYNISTNNQKKDIIKSIKIELKI